MSGDESRSGSRRAVAVAAVSAAACSLIAIGSLVPASDPAQPSAHASARVVRSTTIAVGAVHSLVLKSDGTVWSFGWNLYGELGVSANSGTGVSNPVPVQVMSGAAAVAAGDNYSLVLKSDGTIWSFGVNLDGQLGTSTNIGTTVANPVPVQVMSGASAVAAGAAHSLVLKSDGTVWAFGSNGAGQLGVSTNIDNGAPNPVPVQVMSGASAVAAGGVHSLVLKSDGTVWAFGSNASGQLGTLTNSGISVPNPVPVQVMSGASAVAAGGVHSLVLDSDGTVWSFGANYEGQLGRQVSVFEIHPVPAMVMADVPGDASGIVAGRSYSLVLLSDGTVWSFGADDNGQLGRPDEPGVSEVQPKQVMAGASAMAGAHRHSLVSKSDGTLWSFGDNLYGQLGTTTNLGVDVNPVPAFVMSGVAEPPITQPPNTRIRIDAPADVHMTANRCALGQC